MLHLKVLELNCKLLKLETDQLQMIIDDDDQIVEIEKWRTHDVIKKRLELILEGNP